MASAIASALDLSETYAVDPDVYTMLRHASVTRNIEPWEAEDLPSRGGFVWLPEPFPFLDRRGVVCDVRALQWFTGANEEWTDGPEWIFLATYSDCFTDAETRELYRDPANSSRFHRLLLLDFQGLMLGEPWDVVGEDVGTDAMGTVESQRDLLKLWQSFGAFVQQRVVTTARESGSRPFRRRHAGRQPDIRVVQLRRRSTGTGDGGGPGAHTVEHDHRWMVSGHWRNQWYPSRSAHRQIWVQPFVKGPEDKPLVVRPHVNLVAR